MIIITMILLIYVRVCVFVWLLGRGDGKPSVDVIDVDNIIVVGCFIQFTNINMNASLFSSVKFIS